MSRIYANDDGQLEISTAINDNLSIMDEFNEENFSTTVATPEDYNDFQQSIRAIGVVLIKATSQSDVE